VILVGLTLALDVFGAASGLGAAGQWGRIGTGVAFALAAAASFGLALVLTQHEAADVDGRVRTATTMAMAGLVALVAGQLGVHAAMAGLRLAAPLLRIHQGLKDAFDPDRLFNPGRLYPGL
jgi:threonine/homoserine efflux transporter RhtA